MHITRGFKGKRRDGAADARRLPPGQFLTPDFPVLTAGPTQRTALDQWSMALDQDGVELASWTWEQFEALPQTEVVVDIHCVTKWTKFDTRWRGVAIDDLLDAAGIAPPSGFIMAQCDGGYRTNLSIEDLLGGRAMVATHFDDLPILSAHGGSARLLVPHLYFWKSAKWVRRLSFQQEDKPGFWESLGYHIRGDPWQEQRYEGDH